MSEIREALASAFDSASDGGSETTEPTTTESAPVQESADLTLAPEPPRTDGTDAPTTESTSRTRDDKGRFASKTSTAAPKLADSPVGQRTPTTTDGVPSPVGGVTSPTQAPAVAAQTATPPPELRAPQGWTPAEREHYAKAPAEVQRAITRREREYATEIQARAEHTKVATAFHQTVSPYMAMIQAEGGDAMRAVGSLFQTAAALRTAPPAHKAQLVANIVKTFGVPIDALDSALAGESQSQRATSEYRDPRVDQLLAQMQQQQQQRSQMTAQRGQQEVEAFASKAEFFEDVRHTMADVLEVATKQGRAMSIEDAYSAAVRMSPELSDVFRQREAAKANANAQASTQRATAAASSIRSQPAGVSTTSEPSDLRGMLEAAFSRGNR